MMHPNLTLMLAPGLTLLDSTLGDPTSVSGDSFMWSVADPQAAKRVVLRVQLPATELGQVFVARWMVQIAGVEQSGQTTIRTAAQVFLPTVLR